MGKIMLRLLGPLELIVDNAPVDLGGPRQRVALSMLALNANRVTSVDQLIDAIWTVPPSTAKSQIHICISSLRKLFGAAGSTEAIQTRPPGYLLSVGEDSLDTAQFDRLLALAKGHVDAQRYSEAGTALRRALALWRGPALGDVPGDPVRRGATLLEDRRAAAVEQRLRVDLALGRHREILGELRALIDEQPLREELYALLMLALYRSSRQAEALETCRRARATLVEEAGIEPGAELRELERAILNRDPGLDLEPPAVAEAAHQAPPLSAAPDRLSPRQLPASIGDFSGRETQLAEIKQVLVDEQDRAAPYAVRIIAISGKGGVGKSALAIRVAHELSSRFPDGQLYAEMSMIDGGQPPQVLARFLRAVGVSGPAVPEDLQERIEMYRSRMADKRVLVVLDDVTSEEQVLPLLPGSPISTVITTSRVRLSGLSGAYQVDLDVLDVETSLELLGKVIGESRVHREHDVAIELIKLCGALPLGLRISGARLASRPHWRIRALVQRLRDENHRLDELAYHGLEVRSAIGLSYRGLNRAAQRLLRLFALIEAPDFPAWSAAALLDCDLPEAEDVLESLVDAQLLDAVDYSGARQLRYRFHDLIRVYARERLRDVESEANQHDAVARLLGAWLDLAAEAHRREYGGDYTILHGRASRWRPRSGWSAAVLGVPHVWWESERASLVAAIRQAAHAGLDELCWDLALSAISLFEVKGYFDDWLKTAQLAAEATERTGNRTGHAATLYSLGTRHLLQKRFIEAERCLRTAHEMFAADGNEHGRALVNRNWAMVDRLRGAVEGTLAKYTDALNTMRAVGDRIGEAHILSSLAKLHIDDSEPEAAKRLLDAALRICEETHWRRCIVGWEAC